MIKNTKKHQKRVAWLLLVLLVLTGCTAGKEAGNADRKEKYNTETTAEIQSEADGEGLAADGQESNLKKAVTPIGVETGHYYDYYWDDVFDNITASVKYPYMNLSDEDKKAYPELEQAVTQLMEERKESCLKLYSEAIQTGAGYFTEDREYADSFEVSETVTVRRADTRVLSLMLDGYYYVGGAHGYPYNMGAAFDTETGKRLALTNVITDMELLPEAVEKELETFWDMEYFYENLDMATFFQEYLDDVQWVLDYHGITFYFNPYEIAPYASGISNVTISFADYPELFHQEYQEIPKSYGVELSPGGKFYYDVDGDERLDTLIISAAKGEEENYESQTIRINDAEYEEDSGIYEIEPVLVHTTEGRNYLYVGQQYPDDFWVYSIYDVSDGSVEKIDVVYSGRHSIIKWEEEYYARQVLTDPQNFLLDTFTQMLGTAYGYNIYQVGTDGLPVKEHDWYYIGSEIEFTMQKDLTVAVVDEEGKTTGETEVKTGAKVRYYRTDGENWADILLSDGRIGRVFPEYSNGYWTVDGIDVEEVFEGIIFGG